MKIVKLGLIGLLLIAGGRALVAGQNVPDDPDSSESGLVIRLAEPKAAEGLVESLLPDSEQRIYLHPESLMTGADVISVTFSRDAKQLHVISLSLSAAAAQRLATATQKHTGKRIAIQLDGKTVMAPIVQGVISEKAMITGRFSNDEMRRLFEALVLKNE